MLIGNFPFVMMDTCPPKYLEEYYERYIAREVNRSPLSSTKVKNVWIYTSITYTQLHGMQRDSFTFPLYTHAYVFHNQMSHTASHTGDFES
jgi:hypothetical protein